jgi:siroheme synthase (precorrin-2 oxidase/ferrochelatase)
MEAMRCPPICLNLEGKPVVVVGSGAVGTQTVRDFAACNLS